MARRVVVLGLAVAAVVAPAAGAAPPDYTRTEGLSQPGLETERRVIELPSFDGTELHVEIVEPVAPGPHPVILQASPYHETDRNGIELMQPALTEWFSDRGYAVVMVDLRGTGLSQGCIDYLGSVDAADLKHVVEWAARQSWSNGRVGVIGHSYVAAAAIAAAAQRPEGLATIVPSAGFATMYDHQFQAGVPFQRQWAGAIAAYEDRSIGRKLPGRADFGNHPEETGCGAPNNAALTGESLLSGRYTEWHAARDWSDEAAAAPIPVFAVHATNDEQVRPSAIEWFTRRDRVGDKLWLGRWHHSSAFTSRGEQFRYALLAWFDAHLAGRAVETGPPVEAFLSERSRLVPLSGGEEVLVASAWPPPADELTFHPGSDGTLSATAAPPGGVSFAGTAAGFATEADGTAFTTAPLADDLVLAGVPRMRLSASVTVPRVHLLATLYDEAPGGARTRITHFAISPELRNGLDRVTPVTPAERYDLEPPGFALAHHVRAGHRLVLRVSTSDPDKMPLFAADPHVTVFTGPGATEIALPVVREPSVHPDVAPS